MISPSPTPPQSMPVVPAPRPPDQTPPPEQKKVKLTPAKRRMGQAPLARFIKAILRPIFKLLYYLIRGIRTHKLVALIAAILLLGSIGLTSYALTGKVPLFSSSQDSVEQAVQKNPQLSPDIKTWLLALRDGDINTLENVQRNIPSANRPQDTSLYVMQFSQASSGLKWTNIKVVGPVTAADTLVDTYVEVDMTPPANSGATGPVVTLWHFTTLPDGHIYSLEKVSARLIQ